MKKIFKKTILMASLFLFMREAVSAQVIIGTVSNNSDFNKVKRKYIKKMSIRHINISTLTYKMKNNTEGTLTEDDVNNITKKISISAMAGVVSFPFKFRLQGNKDIETSLSLSGVGGIKLSFNNTNLPMALCFLFGLGPSSVPMNKYNSSLSDTATVAQSAATFSFTTMFIWDKMQIAASIGMDKSLNNRQFNWMYQSKPWASFGIGFNIFSSDQ